MALKYFGRLVFCSIVALSISGCMSTIDESGSNNVQVSPTTVATNPLQTVGDADSTPVNVPSNIAPQVDQSGIAGSENDLEQLLLTDFVTENQQLVPINGWICADSISQSRTYYFYAAGVLDASRSVAIERTLNVNNTHSDINFFWSASATDAILMTSVSRDAGGVLLSTDRQYDVSSIRFEEVRSVQTFTAESVLRGRLICGNYDLR